MSTRTEHLDLAGKVVAITGGARGIGLATATLSGRPGECGPKLSGWPQTVSQSWSISPPETFAENSNHSLQHWICDPEAPDDEAAAMNKVSLGPRRTHLRTGHSSNEGEADAS